jgi:hypothetical protein
VAGDLARWHRGKPSRVDTYRAMRRLHQATAGWSSHLVRTALRATPGAADRVAPHERSHLAPEDARAVDDLRRDGLAMLTPVLDADRIASLTDFARRAPGIARMPDGTSTRNTFEAARHEASAVFIEGRFAWARPEVQHVLADPRIWAIAEHYFGMVPVVHPPQLYWNCASDTELGARAATGLARNYHWDYDGVGNVRLMVYLTDVDEASAPLEIVPGSHRPGALRTRELRHADDGDASPDALKALGLDHGTRVTGPAGTTFVADSHGLHRATSATGRDRLMLLVPLQAGGFAGYYNRPRRVPVRDARFGAALAIGRPELRLFSAGEPHEKVVTFADEPPAARTA